MMVCYIMVFVLQKNDGVLSLLIHTACIFLFRRALGGGKADKFVDVDVRGILRVVILL